MLQCLNLKPLLRLDRQTLQVSAIYCYQEYLLNGLAYKVLLAECKQDFKIIIVRDDNAQYFVEILSDKSDTPIQISLYKNQIVVPFTSGQISYYFINQDDRLSCRKFDYRSRLTQFLVYNGQYFIMFTESNHVKIMAQRGTNYQFTVQPDMLVNTDILQAEVQNGVMYIFTANRVLQLTIQAFMDQLVAKQSKSAVPYQQLFEQSFSILQYINIELSKSLRTKYFFDDNTLQIIMRQQNETCIKMFDLKTLDSLTYFIGDQRRGDTHDGPSLNIYDKGTVVSEQDGGLLVYKLYCNTPMSRPLQRGAQLPQKYHLVQRIPLGAAGGALGNFAHRMLYSQADGVVYLLECNARLRDNLAAAVDETLERDGLTDAALACIDSLIDSFEIVAKDRAPAGSRVQYVLNRVRAMQGRRAARYDVIEQLIRYCLSSQPDDGETAETLLGIVHSHDFSAEREGELTRLLDHIIEGGIGGSRLAQGLFRRLAKTVIGFLEPQFSAAEARPAIFSKLAGYFHICDQNLQQQVLSLRGMYQLLSANHNIEVSYPQMFYQANQRIFDVGQNCYADILVTIVQFFIHNCGADKNFIALLSQTSNFVPIIAHNISHYYDKNVVLQKTENIDFSLYYVSQNHVHMQETCQNIFIRLSSHLSAQNTYALFSLINDDAFVSEIQEKYLLMLLKNLQNDYLFKQSSIHQLLYINTLIILTQNQDNINQIDPLHIQTMQDIFTTSSNQELLMHILIFRGRYDLILNYMLVNKYYLTALSLISINKQTGYIEKINQTCEVFQRLNLNQVDIKQAAYQLQALNQQFNPKIFISQMKQLYDAVGEDGQDMFVKSFFVRTSFYLNVCMYYIFYTDDEEYIDFLEGLGLDRDFWTGQFAEEYRLIQHF